MENADRERMIQSGVHYSEMIPREHLPSEKYLAAFYDALGRYSLPTAKAVGIVSRKIIEDKGENAVIVSLARAGTPIGILIKRFIANEYGIDILHYTVSIIRGRGIDKNAMKYLLERYSSASIQFVDGWTGKGAIKHQLDEAMKDYPGSIRASRSCPTLRMFRENAALTMIFSYRRPVSIQRYRGLSAGHFTVRISYRRMIFTVLCITVNLRITIFLINSLTV